MAATIVMVSFFTLERHSQYIRNMPLNPADCMCFGMSETFRQRSQLRWSM